MQLIFKVEKQKLFLVNKELVVSDTINYLAAKVDFGRESDWDGLEKWMHFAKCEEHYVINLIDDQIAAERGINLGAGVWMVYMHGNLIEDGMSMQRITTNQMRLVVMETGDLSGEPFPDVPPSSGEQIIAQAVEAREAAKAAAEEAKKVVESGGASEEQIEKAVNAYLDENPVETGATKEQAEQIEANAQAIEELKKSGTGQPGQPGEDGRDGVSPTVTITPITGGNRVTITDVNGSKTFDVMNGTDGRDGDPGANGVSPTIGVSAITGGHRITITDVNGTQYFDVMDGAAGSGEGGGGAPGKDGVSPTVTITPISGGSRVVITDVSGAKTFDVMNGTDGQDGAPGAPGVDGKTPVKGVDYFTEAEKTEIARQAAGMVEVPKVELDDTLKEQGKAADAAAVGAELTQLKEKNAAQDETLTQINQAINNVSFETDKTLTFKDGVLSVNTSDKVEEDNTLPVTSAAVYTEVGNINALLETI